MFCGTFVSAGIGETPEWEDWSTQETTPDQRRIEAVLGELELDGKDLLHIGVGNSSLAASFSGSLKVIDGITVQPNEVAVANRLGLPNYRVLLVSKYSDGVVDLLRRQYDFIVDNNPTTFCCCRRHLATMLANYAASLKTAGLLVSDSVGLGWTSQRNDRRWGLTTSEWIEIASTYGLAGSQLTDSVVGLKKARTWRLALHTASLLIEPWRSPWISSTAD